MKSLRRYIFENLIIFESQESKSIDAAKKLVMGKFGWDRSKADSFVRNDLRQDLPSLRDVKTAKFILGVTRMFCDGELKDAGTINDLNTTLPYISKDGVNDKWDRNLNGKSVKDVIAEFKGRIESDNEARRKEVESQSIEGESDYDVIPIDTFEEAKKYSKFTDWCITRDEEAFNSYSRNGINRFWFCLKKGFEDIQRRSDGCPLDDYGLSMLAVCVKPNGSLATCTCRWNHDNGGDDNILDEKGISRIINRNFYEVFIPNKEFEKFSAFDNIKKINDEPERYVVEKNDRYGICGPDGKLIHGDWFNSIDFIEDGYICVCLNGRKNIMDMAGDFISRNWYDEILCDPHSTSSNGRFIVELNGKQNIIDMSGATVLRKWFDKLDWWRPDGYIEVEFENKYNLIDAENRLISSEWYDFIGVFKQGYALVSIDAKFNYIDSKGRLLSDEWFDSAKPFHESGHAVVLLHSKYNIIDVEGKFISDVWFDYVLKMSRESVRIMFRYKPYEMRYDGTVNVNGQWRKLTAEDNE